MSTQQSLPLEGSNQRDLTEWFDGPPPCTGWWNTRLKTTQEEPVPPEEILRRFFKGSGYSRPCHLGVSNTVSERAKEDNSVFSTNSLQYQGLKQPAPEGYDYELTPTTAPSRRKLVA